MSFTVNERYENLAMTKVPGNKQERWNPVTRVASIKSCNGSEHNIDEKISYFCNINGLNWNFMS